MELLLAKLDSNIEKLRPQYATTLQAGLSMDRIVSFEERLPFQFPKELIGLYMWHNGSSLDGIIYDFIPGCMFMPLERAVDIYELYFSFWSDDPPELRGWQENWFPFLDAEGDGYFVEIQEDMPSRVWSYGLEDLPPNLK